MRTDTDRATPFPRPRPTTAVHVVVGLVLLLSAPAGTVLIGRATSSREVWPYLAIGAIHLVLLAVVVPGGIGWFRATRAPRLLDAVPALCVAAGAFLSLGLTLVLAEAQGIRGSALPRLRQGVPLAADLPYLLAVGTAVATLLVVLLSVVLMVRRARSVRDAVGEVRSELTGSMSRLRTRIESGPGPQNVTHAEDGLLSRLLSPVTRLLVVVGAIVSLAALLMFSLTEVDRDTAERLTMVVVFTPAVPMLWAVLESLWRPDEEFGIPMAALYRTIAGPPAIGVIALMPSLLTGLLPPVWTGFSAQHLASIGDGGLVDAGAPVVAFVGFAMLVAAGAGMVGGLVLSVAVVLPVTALFLPGVMVADNELSTRPADRRRNVASVRLLSLLILMIFVFSALIAGAEPGELRFGLAMAALAVLVVLTVAILRTQRVDHEARRRSGHSARVPNPYDPPPQDEDTPSEGSDSERA